MSVEEVYSRLDDGKDDPGGGQPGPGDILDYPGEDGEATPSELAQAEQETKIAVQQAAQQAKVCGKLPAGIARLVEELLEPKVDWREVLRDFCQSNSKADYSWTRPNRRFVGMGLHLPSLHSINDLGTIAIAVDTSGSVGQDDLNQFVSEANAILEEFDVDAWMLPVDSKVNDPRRYGKEDLPLSVQVCGGGGTSFVPPFKWMEESGVYPDAMVYLTDGLCHSYPDEPDYPVLWISSRAKMNDAPFGRVVMM